MPRRKMADYAKQQVPPDVQRRTCTCCPHTWTCWMSRAGEGPQVWSGGAAGDRRGTCPHSSMVLPTLLVLDGGTRHVLNLDTKPLDGHLEQLQSGAPLRLSGCSPQLDSYLHLTFSVALLQPVFCLIILKIQSSNVPLTSSVLITVSLLVMACRFSSAHYKRG